MEVETPAAPSLRPTAGRRAHQPAVGTSCNIIDPVIDFFKYPEAETGKPPGPWFLLSVSARHYILPTPTYV